MRPDGISWKYSNVFPGEDENMGEVMICHRDVAAGFACCELKISDDWVNNRKGAIVALMVLASGMGDIIGLSKWPISWIDQEG